jgi:hypothetical protein
MLRSASSRSSVNRTGRTAARGDLSWAIKPGVAVTIIERPELFAVDRL